MSVSPPEDWPTLVHAENTAVNDSSSAMMTAIIRNDLFMFFSVFAAPASDFARGRGGKRRDLVPLTPAAGKPAAGVSGAPPKRCPATVYAPKSMFMYSVRCPASLRKESEMPPLPSASMYAGNAMP